MQVLSLDHINLRVEDVAKTLGFFGNILGMDVRPGPGGSDTERGGWVYDARNHPILHITASDIPFPSDSQYPFTHAAGSGTIHHVALACQGYDAMLARIQSAGLEHWEGHVPSINLRQIFVPDANDILFELNFSGE